MPKHFYTIGLIRRAGGDLTYHSLEPLKVGQLVEVKLRGSAQPGIVIAETHQPDFTTKPVERPLELQPLPEPLVKLGGWLASYYAAPQESAWQSLLPSGLLKQRRARPATTSAQKTNLKPLKLTADQTAAYDQITTSPKTTSLLRGITGSGKTEVYQALAAATLLAGQSVIILVPEISLTPQTRQRFEDRFGHQITITHSRLSETERFAIWRQVLDSTKPQIVIGPRSALFLPLRSVGLIVIDEAHESSYKQEQAPRFEASVAAAQLARLHGAKLVLGSATPGLREAYLAQSGVIEKVELLQAFNQLTPPPPSIIDIKDPDEFPHRRLFSKTLEAQIALTLKHGRQTLLFLNRRGSASSQICGHCGQVSLCPNCRLPLTFHADQARLLCHICNFNQTPPAVCPHCGRAELRFLGTGTKRIEAELLARFPEAKVARLDKDSLVDINLDELYRDLTSGKIDILIGTQMIAKGLDLPAMETVGVVLADSSLYLPDYTATERTYDLLTQVSGRAGRRDRPGQVIIQTYSPKHPAIAALATHDYWAFAASELAERAALNYPPYCFLLKLSYSHQLDETARSMAQDLARQLQLRTDLIVAGPAPAFRQFAAGKSHWQVIVKAKRRHLLQALAAELPNGWIADLDPVNLL